MEATHIKRRKWNSDSELEDEEVSGSDLANLVKSVSGGENVDEEKIV